MDDQPRGIGHRIADARKARRLTQQTLATRANISLSLLRKVEQGSRDATPAMVAAVAGALSIDVTALTGQPYDQVGRRVDPLHDRIPALRRALTYWDLPSDRAPDRSIEDLAVAAATVAEHRRAGRHAHVAELLPDLLMDTTAATHAAPTGPARERAFELLTVLLFAAHSVTYKTGYEDLSTVVEDRISWAAAGSSDPLMGALAAWTRTTSMLLTGSYDIGRRLLDGVLADLGRGELEDRPEAIRMTGALQLRCSILAARGGDGASAHAYLGDARATAARAGGDHDGGRYQLSFGPANTGVHAVAAAVELGDGPRAVAIADDLALPPELPPIRAGHHFVDLSRAYLWTGKKDAALRCLDQARQLAPQQTRHHPTTREVVRMLVRLHRRSNEPLNRMVGWVGGEL